MCAACGEMRIGEEERTGFAWIGRKARETTYTVIEAAGERIGLVEGCIVLGTIAELELLDRHARSDFDTLGAAVGSPLLLWPHATVTYDIDPAIRHRDRIEAAIDHYRQRQVGIRFIERSKVEPAHYPNWIVFRAGGSGSGCTSHVGCKGSRQFVNIEDEVCETGNIIHEIGHALGLFHEQSRSDRDAHIEIDLNKVSPRARPNFTQYLSHSRDFGAYDFGSIMHYRLDAFGIGGAQVMKPIAAVPEGVVVGQRVGLSDGDVATLRALYGLGLVLVA